ncbi:MAG TPA: hypothetical protein VKY34_06105 [Xanthomarina sp.]|nr:hypothetical protein [Xanthomarina sp.]
MKKFKTQKINKTDVFVRYLIGSILTVLLSTGEIKGFTFFFLLVFIILLFYTGVVKKSLLKAKFYPNT